MEAWRHICAACRLRRCMFIVMKMHVTRPPPFAATPAAQGGPRARKRSLEHSHITTVLAALTAFKTVHRASCTATRCVCMHEHDKSHPPIPRREAHLKGNSSRPLMLAHTFQAA